MRKHLVGDYMSAHETPEKHVVDRMPSAQPAFEFAYDKQRRTQNLLAKTAMTHSAESETSRFEKESLATTLRKERIAYGFYSHTGEEKDSIEAIIRRSDEQLPVDKYLGEVEYHMSGVQPEDPTAAIRSLAHGFEKYATEAHKEVGFAHLFAEDAARRMHSEHEMLLDVFDRVEISSGGSTRRTLTSLARLRATDLFVVGEGENPLSATYALNSKDPRVLDKQLYPLLDGLSVGNVLSINERYIAEETQRFTYWRDILEQALEHDSIRGQVEASLARLDSMRPPKA